MKPSTNMNTQPMLTVTSGSRNLPRLEQNVLPRLPTQTMERHPPSRLRRSSRSRQQASHVPEYLETKCAGGKALPPVHRENSPERKEDFTDSVTGIGTEPRLLLRPTCQLTTRAGAVGKLRIKPVKIDVEACRNIGASAFHLTSWAPR